MSDALHPLAGNVAHPSRQHDLVARWKLWTGLLLAPLAFSLQVLASYTVGSDLCSADGAPLPWLVAINVVTALLAVIGMAIAWSNWRATRNEAVGDIHATADRGDGRTRFMALFAFSSSALLLFGLLLQPLVLVYFGPCTGFPALG